MGSSGEALRDCCSRFDPTEYYSRLQENRSGEFNGIRIVMQLAKEVRYVNAFNSNNLMVLI